MWPTERDGATMWPRRRADEAPLPRTTEGRRARGVHREPPPRPPRTRKGGGRCQKSAGGAMRGLGQASASVGDEQGARGECAEGCPPCGRRGAWAPPCGPAAGPTMRRSRGPPTAAERVGSTVSPPPPGRRRAQGCRRRRNLPGERGLVWAKQARQ